MHREQRVALASFRHHSRPCKYSGKYGVISDIRFMDHKGVAVLGDDDEIIGNVNAVSFLNSELEKSEAGDIIVSKCPVVTYELGREIQNDGYIRVVEILEK